MILYHIALADPWERQVVFEVIPFAFDKVFYSNYNGRKLPSKLSHLLLNYICKLHWNRPGHLEFANYFLSSGHLTPPQVRMEERPPACVRFVTSTSRPTALCTQTPRNRTGPLETTACSSMTPTSRSMAVDGFSTTTPRGTPHPTLLHFTRTMRTDI